MAVEENGKRACLNISESECNRKGAQTLGFRKIAIPGINTSGVNISGINTSLGLDFCLCPLPKWRDEF